VHEIFPQHDFQVGTTLKFAENAMGNNKEALQVQSSRIRMTNIVTSEK
jgi:hypothetical protein